MNANLEILENNLFIDNTATENGGKLKYLNKLLNLKE